MQVSKKLSLLSVFVAGALGGTLVGQDVLMKLTPKAWAEDPPAAVQADNMDSAGQGMIHAQVASLGDIIDAHNMPENDLTAWLVQAPNGKRMTFYTTADGKNIFSGTVWNLATKQNINHVFAALQTQPAPTPQAQVQEINETQNPLLGKYSGDIPEAIKALETLGGPKIGKGGPGETLYVIIDPRCPYCHQAYASLKPYMDKGVTIKWIPTVALGNTAQGLPLANAVLHAKDRAELDKIMENPSAYPRNLGGEDQQVLQRNLQFMFQAFEQNGGQAGVPVAFFVDQNNGQPRMMMGLSEEVVIHTILGRL